MCSPRGWCLTGKGGDRAQEHVQRSPLDGAWGRRSCALKYGISDATFYKRRSKYGGLGKRLRSLEAENAKVKRLLAEAMLDVSTLKEMFGKDF